MDKKLENDLKMMKIALSEAHKSQKEGGIPVGSILAIDDTVIAQGHNQRIQKSSAILHGEMDCLENAGRLTASDYHRTTLYSTLSPCDMCTGAILLYKIPRVVIAENETFMGAEQKLLQAQVELINLNLDTAKQMMNMFIKENPQLWNEDIGI